MSQAPRLGRAGVLAGLLSVIALSCSSDIVELLPVTGGASSGGAAGQQTATSGASTSGSSVGGSPTSQGGFAGATGGGGGSNGGNGGSTGGGCVGFGCAGENGFGGTFTGPNCGNGTGSCTPCLNDPQCPPDQHCSPFLNNVCVQCAVKGSSQCKVGYNCDVFLGRCAPGCDSTSDCNDGRVCEPNSGTCVSCIDNQECEQDGDPRTSICYLRRCVECTQHLDCARQGGEQRWCSKLQCVQCLTDKDCDPDGRSHCDVPKGFCE